MMGSGGSKSGIVLLTIAASLVGPCTALLHEWDVLSVGPVASLWPVAFVVASAVVGLGTSHAFGSRLSRWLGLVSAVPNLIVLAVYGFLLLFFGLGGSR